MSQQLKCYHISTLEEALLIVARDRADGLPNPTFTIDAALYPGIEAALNKSYSVDIEVNTQRVRFSGILLYVKPVAENEARGLDPRA